MKRKPKPVGYHGKFVMMTREILYSKAFRELSQSAKLAYIYFAIDQKSKEDKKVILTYGQAKEHGVCRSPSTFSKVKKELVHYGFLDPLKRGGLNEHSVFELSGRWINYGEVSSFNGKSKFIKKKVMLGFSPKYFGSEKDKKRRQKKANT